MNRRLVFVLLLVCGVPAALIAQQPAQPPEVYRFDFTLVRSEGEDAAERSYSMLVAGGQRARVREGATKVPGGSQAINVGISLSVQVREPVGARLSVGVDLEINETVGDANERVIVAGSTTTLAPLGGRVSLLSVQSQDGKRQYELLASIQKVDE